MVEVEELVEVSRLCEDESNEGSTLGVAEGVEGASGESPSCFEASGVGVVADCLPLSSSEKTDEGDKGEKGGVSFWTAPPPPPAEEL